MSFATQIFLIIISILQFIFPFFEFDTPEVPEEPSSSIVEEIPTEDITDTTTCNHKGGSSTCLTKARCSLCMEEYGEFGEHIYSVTTKANTCLEGGYSIFTCKLCTYTYRGAETEPKGHDYDVKGQAPTCTNIGYLSYTCKRCGDFYSENEIPATGHSYKNMGETPADCENDGFITFTCENCFDSYTEKNSDKLGHSYEQVITYPTCKNVGYTTHNCTTCGDTFKTDEVPALGHSFTNYISDNNASCSYDGTKTAYCDNGCGLTSTLNDVGSMLPHVDENNDKHCDNGGEELFASFSHLTYPSNAVLPLQEMSTTVEKMIQRADKVENQDIYAANKGHSDSGIVVSPYYILKVDGKDVPVYGAVTYSGTTEKGTLHSFSEIYIEKGEYCTVRVDIESIYSGFKITDAKIIPESLGETAKVENGIISAVLSGYGAHTFLVNGENQAYTYTIFIREEIDEDAEIAALREQGYNVAVVEGYMPLDYVVFSGPEVSNQVIYLKKGAYVAAEHKFEINSDADNSGNPETTAAGANAVDHNGIGLNRFPFISAHNTSNIKVLGYGVFDLTHLDRGERRGMVFSFANNVEVRGVKLINAPEWSFILYRCDGVTIKDVDIFGYRQNSDAFDICNSTNITVDRCFARTGDDLFAVKALGGDQNAVADNITFKNCYAWAAKARAFGIFGESNRSVSNVTFKDSYVLMHDATWDYDRIPAIGIVAETADPNNGAISFKNITFENIEISRNYAAAANVIIFNQITNNFTIDNIVFKNISYQSNNVLNRIVTYSNNGTITNVQFENTTCAGTNVVDSNKTAYFSEESYWGGYITVK